MTRSVPVSPASVVIVAALAAGCDRQEINQYAAKAERQVERAVPAVDDATVTAKVKSALIATPEVSGLRIDVDTSDNVVSLNGTVGSAEQRELAERTARSVEGVRDVKNNLVVKS